MLNHTKKIKLIYEKIQQKLYYMIPEKWSELYLYTAIINKEINNITESITEDKGELYFYYIPKGLLKKNPVNVYEIPSKYNLDEDEYLELVESLYDEFKELRIELKKSCIEEIWSNLTLIIKNNRLQVEYVFENLNKSNFNSYERHIIWRYKYLDIDDNYLSKEEKQIIYNYIQAAEKVDNIENFEMGIYVGEYKNIVEYDSIGYQETENIKKSDEKVQDEINIRKKYNEYKSSKFDFLKYKNEYKTKNKRKIKIKADEIDVVELENNGIVNKENYVIKNQLLAFQNDYDNDNNKKDKI